MKTFKKNEEAVSPVIGVILMVAITVILAAVIAAFVFNIGGSQSKTPVASLQIKSASATNDNITISHSGGDAVDLSKVKAIIEQGGSRNTISPLNTSTQIIYVGDNLVIQENSTVSVYVNGAKGGTTGTSSNSFDLAQGLVTVTLIDTETNQQILSTKATVN